MSEELILDVAPKMEVAGVELGLSVTCRPSVPQAALGTLRYKDLIGDSVLVVTERGQAAGQVRRPARATRSSTS